MIDYKINRLTRYGDVTEVIIHFFEGDVTTELEPALDALPGDKPVSVTRYRRTKKLGEKKIVFRGDIAPTREERNEYLVRMLNKKLGEYATTLRKPVATFQEEKLPYGEITNLTITDYAPSKLK